VPAIAPVLMKAGAVGEPGPFEDHPLAEVTRPVPQRVPARARTGRVRVGRVRRGRVRVGRVTVVVEVCGGEQTNAHLPEGDLSLKSGLVVQYQRARK
jgi:hypothetical protein